MTKATKTYTPAAFQAFLNGDITNVLAAIEPGGIEQQEADGQANLAKTADRLPFDISYPHDITHAQVTTALGIQFGEPVDKVFIEATLPDGWKIVPTSHSMWSDLLDDKGRKRAAIFFKAAFYDYSAHMSFECRYYVMTYVDHEVNGVMMRVCQVIDAATEAVLWTSEPADKKDFDKQDRNSAAARKWLDEKFPKHSDPFAYWND